MLRDVQGQRRLSHRRPGRQDDQLAAMQPAAHLVELGIARADSLDALTRIEERVQPALIFLDHLRRTRQRGFPARIAQLQQTFFGARQDLLGVFFTRQAPVHQMLRSEDDPAQERFVFDDADVTVEIENPRQPVVQRYQIAQAVAGFQLVVAQQFVGQRDAVDALAALVQLHHAVENAAVLLQAEVVRFQDAGHLDKLRVVE